MTWSGQWDGRWDGYWDGSGAPAEPGAMFCRVVASGSLTGALEGIAEGGFTDIAAVITGSGSLEGALYQPQNQRDGGGGKRVRDDYEPSPRLWWLRSDRGAMPKKAAKKAARIIIEGVAAEVSKEEIKEAIAPLLKKAPGFDWAGFFAEARYQATANQTKNADLLTAILAKAEEQWEAEREEEEILLML